MLGLGPDKELDMLGETWKSSSGAQTLTLGKSSAFMTGALDRDSSLDEVGTDG